MASSADSLLSHGHGHFSRYLACLHRSKWIYLALIIILSFSSLALFKTPAFDPIASLRPKVSTSTISQFHLLVPATASNPDLCRLIASSSVLGYPAPVLINWNTTGSKKESLDQHLAKVDGILDYLKRLPAERDDDLVLVIDGYDVIFQLRPDVMIGRYYELIESSNKRLLKRFGAKKMQRNGIYHSVVFGADKACWPQNVDRAACWAAPESTLPRWILGPDTDSQRFITHNRPRWLNSGTIMGPVKDVRAIVQATLNLIHEEYKDFPWFKSDQYWFAEIWSKQEYNRILLDKGPLQSNTSLLWHRKDYKGGGKMVNTKLQIPKLGERENEFELHMTLDYETTIFQTMSFQYDYFAWQHYNQSNTGYLGPQRVMDEVSFDIAEDILRSPAPFSRFEKDEKDSELKSSIPLNATWRSVVLGTNTLTHSVFPLLHYTGPKLYREWWWPRLWYYPYITDFLKVSNHSREETYGKSIDGRSWQPYVPARETTMLGNGAYDDQGSFLQWDHICKAHEKSVFQGIGRNIKGIAITGG